VVEDDPYTREALVKSLETLSYQVLAAGDGQEALDICQQAGEQVALVLSDLVMPGMGGIALFGALQERHPAIKLVALSGHPLEDPQDLYRHGVAYWLKKPVSLERLADVLRRALRGTQE